MNNNIMKILHELLSAAYRANDEQQLNEIVQEYSDNLNSQNDKDLALLIDDVNCMAGELVALRKDIADTANVFSVVRTDQERAELAEVKRILEDNLLDYHFQPIVSTTDGTICSYEALMRPRSTLCPSPYHVIKYAELMGKLNEVEKATFVNVLNLIGNGEEMFYNRPVFINSMPSAKLSDDDFELVKQLLEKHSERIVVEMTEQSEMGDTVLEAIKKMYNRLNVKTAIDDYGTGYSNVQNLLRYAPDYVKIDRSMLSAIQNNRQKRYFVREIIDFCHENGILSLAEGVETAEELQTVIHLGVDLVQGYYTSRPSAVIVESIPYEIIQEINLYRQEREDGRKQRIYTADKSERVLLDRLEKGRYKSILIGKNGSGEVTVAGSPGFETGIHIDVLNDFKGSIILSDAILSNVKSRPCINIGENCEVHLELKGTNQLKNGGIKVPESSKLHVCGDGDLSITIDASGFYAIGNDNKSRHGELLFDQGVSIDNHAPGGVCIGSALGGKINIRRGQFFIKMSGYIGVGIGSFESDTDIDLFASNITINMSVENGVAIGSYEKNCRLSALHSSLKIYLSGMETVGIGTLGGESCKVDISESSTTFNISSDHCSSIAALYGETKFNISKANITIVAKGDNALAIGGYNGNVKSVHTNSDTSIDMVTKIEEQNHSNAEKLEISGGRASFIINGKEIWHQ